MTIVVQRPCSDLGELIHSSNVGAEPTQAESPGLKVEVLTRRMVDGDENAYREFHGAYCHRLSRYLLVVTQGNEDAAREALQAALVRVVRHIKVFHDEATFWNWLTVLARSSLSDQRKKHRRYFAFLDRFTRHARAEATDNTGETDAQLLALLERGLNGLPPDERALVEKKYFGGESVREIATGLGLSEKAVDSRLVRARRKLKESVLTELKHDTTE